MAFNFKVKRLRTEHTDSRHDERNSLILKIFAHGVTFIKSKIVRRVLHIFYTMYLWLCLTWQEFNKLNGEVAKCTRTQLNREGTRSRGESTGA